MTGTTTATSSGSTILVTGARGFIGSTLLTMARGEQATFVGADKEEADLRDRPAVRKLIERVQPIRIVHLAASLSKGQSAEDEQQQWEHTLIAGTNVVELAAELGVRQLVMAGSVEELGDREGPLAPTAPAEPRSPYGLCKSLLREYSAYWSRRTALRIDWFRPFLVYGPGQTSGQMLLPTAFRAAKRREKAQFSDGLQKRDFIHVEDLADWILRAVRVKFAGDKGVFRIHHLGTGQAVEVRDVLRAIVEEFPDAQFDIGAIARRAGEPLLRMSAEYSSNEAPLDTWRPRYDWRKGIAHTCAWWRQRDES